jgi:hypothetical protein
MHGHTPRYSRLFDLGRLALLSALPLAGATLGALIDERTHLGFTNWRSACRASGYSLGSTVAFSLELLPTAFAGLLLAGVILQGIGFALRRRGRHLERCLAVHAGCAFSMPIGLVLCAFALPVSVMLVTDVLLTVAAAWLVIRLSAWHDDAPTLHP